MVGRWFVSVTGIVKLIFQDKYTPDSTEFSCSYWSKTKNGQKIKTDYKVWIKYVVSPKWAKFIFLKKLAGNGK